MADIAQIGFAADTAALSDAKSKMEQLSPAAGRAERAADRLNKMLDAGSRAAASASRAALLKANADLSAARASATATQEEIKAAQAAQRKAKAAYDMARATQAQAQASKLAAAAAGEETAAVNAATNAAKRRASVPLISASTGGNRAGPWGMPSSNDNRPGSGGKTAVDGMLAAQASPSNIAAQFQDIGVTAAMGMNPLLIALQQGTQLSMAFAGGVKGVGAAIAMMLSPVALLTIGLTAVAAALLQAVNWTKVAQVALNGLATAIEVLGPYLIAAAAGLALLYAPAIIAGLTIVSELVLGLTARLIGLAAGFLLANPAIAFLAGLVAVVAALNIFRDEVTRIFGVDIVAAAKDGINWIVGAFKGGYEGIKAAWSMLPAAIGDIFIQVYNVVLDRLQKLINASIEGINSLVDKLPEWMKPEGGLITWRADFSKWQAEGTGAAADVAAIFRSEMDKAIGADYVGNLADAVTGALSNAADKIRSLASGLGVTDDKKKKKSGGGKTDAEKFDDIASGAERNIAALEAERAAIGMNELAALKLTKQTELLNQAKAQGLVLSDSERNYLIAAADAMADLEYSTQKAREALAFAKDTTKGFFSDLFSGLQQGKSVWDSFADAAMNALQKIADKLLNEVLDAIFEVISAAGGSGGGGLFGSLIKGIGSLLGFAKGGTFKNGISARSNTIVDSPTIFAFAKGTGLMGEAGPEAIMPLKRGPDGSLGVQMHSEGGGAGGMTVSPVFAPTYTVEAGATQEAVAELYKLREQDQKQFPAMVGNAVAEIRTRNGNI